MVILRRKLKSLIPVPIIRMVREVSDGLHFRLWQARLKEAPRLRQPIFMIGSPRSGTSIAVRLFARPPPVANRTEAGLIWDPEHYFDPEADHLWTADRVTEGHVRRVGLRIGRHSRYLGNDGRQGWQFADMLYDFFQAFSRFVRIYVCHLYPISRTYFGTST